MRQICWNQRTKGIDTIRQWNFTLKKDRVHIMNGTRREEPQMDITIPILIISVFVGFFTIMFLLLRDDMDIGSMDYKTFKRKALRNRNILIEHNDNDGITSDEDEEMDFDTDNEVNINNNNNRGFRRAVRMRRNMVQGDDHLQADDQDENELNESSDDEFVIVNRPNQRNVALNADGIPLIPRPAPLVRRDSARSDDHDMTALHFFALMNRPSQDIDTVINQIEDEDNFNTKNNFSSKLLATSCTSSSHSLSTSSSSSSSSQSNSSLQLIPDSQTRCKKKTNFDINAPVRFLKLTALHFAAINADPSFIQNLIRHGANLNMKDALGRTPLRHAVNLSRAEVIATLLEAGAEDSPDKDGTTALRVIVFHNDLEMVKLYCKHRPDAVSMPSELPLTSSYIILTYDFYSERWNC
jgi:hypothetical protein